MTKRGLVSHIDVMDERTYRDTLFLTLDLDWAHDAVLADTIAMVEDAAVSATWFVTHDTPLLEQLRHNPRFELGIHPNFNFLLDGDARNGRSAEEVVDRLLKIVPDARCVRSHSLTVSERLLDLFEARGIRHVSNVFVPKTGSETVLPWCLWSGLTIVPHCWQDNAMMRIGSLGTSLDGVLAAEFAVVDFHPIHVFLNSSSMECYEATRALHLEPDMLILQRSNARDGTRQLLRQVLAARR